MEMNKDILRIACNYSEATKTATKGSLAFVLLPNGGNLHDRLFILSRSKSRRWIKRWESIRLLTNFRIKKIPQESTLYLKLIEGCDETALESIKNATAN